MRSMSVTPDRFVVRDAISMLLMSGRVSKYLHE